MQLFEINSETGLPQFDPIVFELKPLKVLIDRDKTKNKDIAKAELAFIWLYADPKSDYFGVPNEEKKLAEIIQILNLPKDWKFDAKIKAAIEFYQEITKTTTTNLLEKMKKTINKLSDFLEDIDFTLLDKNDKPIYDMKKVVDTATQIPKLLTTLKDIEDRVKEEQSVVEKKIRGDRQLSVHEDGIDFTN